MAWQAVTNQQWALIKQDLPQRKRSRHGGLPCPPFSVLARRVRRTPSHTAVELTQEIQQTGIEVVPVSRLVQ
jgi:hypothetical protein